MLLASYTWSEDAQRWGSLLPHDRIEQALEDTQIHPQVLKEFEVGASWMWHDDEFAGGAFALFDPGQQTLLHKRSLGRKGRIHFAGEHASLHHAWIQGALESGLADGNCSSSSPLREQGTSIPQKLFSKPRRCRVLLSSEPALAGFGACPESSPWHEPIAYVAEKNRDPFRRVLAQNRVMLHHGHSQAVIVIP